jgi:DNA adenine methylase
MTAWRVGQIPNLMTPDDPTDAAIARIPEPSRVMAPIRWFGGKGKLAKQIVPLLPPSRVYVEPYCGAASVLWHLPEPRPIEVLNDLDGEVVNLFRCLQDRHTFAELRHRIVWTPYSLAEFRRALAVGPDAPPVERAWAFYVRMNQGFGGSAKTEGNWGRTFIEKGGMADTTNNWRGRMRRLDWWHDRLSRVQIDSRDALEVIRYWDTPDTTFYVDPPYVHSTRRSSDDYAVEQDDDHHRRLVETLLSIRGAAVVSGYDHPIYRPLADAGWRVHRVHTACSVQNKRGKGGAGSALREHPRVETIWVKPHDRAGELWAHAREQETEP